jgi:hypothetical protein
METNIEISKSKKTIVLGIVSVIFLAALGYFFLKPDALQPVPKASGLEIATQTVNFLDKLLQQNGGFFNGYKCKAGNCVVATTEAISTYPATLAFYELSKATGDQSLETKAMNAMNYSFDACKANVTLCERNFVAISKLYEITKDRKYLDEGLLRSSEEYLAAPVDEVSTQNTGQKLALLYDATGDKRYYDRLIEVANELLDLNEDQDPAVFQHTTPTEIQNAWSVYLPAYRISKDSVYLSQVKTLYDNIVYSEMEQYGNAVSVVLKIMENLIDVSEITGEAKYKAKAVELLQNTVYYLSDNPSNKKFTGDFGFIDNYKKMPEYDKVVIYNGWLARLYLRMPSEQFKLRN